LYDSYDFKNRVEQGHTGSSDFPARSNEPPARWGGLPAGSNTFQIHAASGWRHDRLHLKQLPSHELHEKDCFAKNRRKRPGGENNKETAFFSPFWRLNRFLLFPFGPVIFSRFARFAAVRFGFDAFALDVRGAGD
jgi:hypothetical protein